MTEVSGSAFLAAIPDVMIVIDTTSRIRVAGHGIEDMFGYTSEELVGKPIGVLLPERYRDIHEHHLRHYMESPKKRAMGTGKDLYALRKDGSEFPTEISLYPDRTAEDPVVIAAVRDITDSKAIEEQLRQAQKMEAIGNLTGGMAHDFNNLLGIVIGNLDLLRERLKGDAESDKLAGEALTAALRGSDLTRQLLAFARRQPLNPGRIDVNKLVAGISTLLSRSLTGNIEVKLDLADGVWPVIADPTQLEASLVNLANNAHDAMPDGGVLTIMTSNRRLDEDYTARFPGLAPGDFAMIEVSDNGSGIPPEVLSEIFEPFFTTKAQNEGTGLGLSMVFGFFKQSEGHISVYSEEGVGTNFHLYLPRDLMSAAAAKTQAVAKPLQGGGETILVVEDDDGFRRVAMRQLEKLGYRLFEAEDGRAALDILENETVDLLFTDVIMPKGMSGYDLARVVRSRWPAIKVLFTSGFAEKVLNNNGNGEKPVADAPLLAKPYRKEELARSVRDVLDG